MIAFVSQWCFIWKSLITSTFFQTYSNPFFKLTWYFRSFAWILPLKRAREEIDYAIGGRPVITDLFREEEKETLYNDRAVSFPKISHASNPASRLARTVVCMLWLDGSDGNIVDLLLSTFLKILTEKLNTNQSIKYKVNISFFYCFVFWFFFSSLLIAYDVAFTQYRISILRLLPVTAHVCISTFFPLTSGWQLEKKKEKENLKTRQTNKTSCSCTFKWFGL